MTLPCPAERGNRKMKLQYTAQELAVQFAALEQLFGKAVLVDPRRNVTLDPATLQPTGQAEALPPMDKTGRGIDLAAGENGPALVLCQAITVDGCPLVAELHCDTPRELTRTVGAENSLIRALAQVQEELRRDYATGAFNARYINGEYRRFAEQAARQGQPVGVVLVRINEYWTIREKESLAAAGSVLNMAAGLLLLNVGTDPHKAVLARLEDGLFAIVTVGSPAGAMLQTLRTALNEANKEYSISLSRRGSFTTEMASAEWGETSSWDMMLSLAQSRL